MRIRFAILLCAAALVGLVGLSGCDEISARRKVQEANDKYKDGKYDEAAQLYEEALQKDPELAIAHHNLGVTYYKLLSPTDPDKAKQADYADKATSHLMTYLKDTSDPKEQILIRKLVTEIWIETSQIDKALAFWEAEHQARPQDTEVLGQLAGLNNKKGDWRTAIKWLRTWVDTAPDDDGKAQAYQQIGNLCFLRMLANSPSGSTPVVGAERIELSDIGIGALQKALALEPKNLQIISTLGSLNQQRALAEGSRLGFQIDLANHQNWMRVFGVLRTEAQQTPPPAETPPPSGDGS